jgi:hypothetical protein
MLPESLTEIRNFKESARVVKPYQSSSAISQPKWFSRVSLIITVSRLCMPDSPIGTTKSSGLRLGTAFFNISGIFPYYLIAKGFTIAMKILCQQGRTLA